jgi:hypothetical protein
MQRGMEKKYTGYTEETWNEEVIYSNRSYKDITFISYGNFPLVMNSKKQITIVAVVLSSFLPLVVTISGFDSR